MIAFFIGFIILILSLLILNLIGTLLEPYEDWWEQTAYGLVVILLLLFVGYVCYQIGNIILINI